MTSFSWDNYRGFLFIQLSKHKNLPRVVSSMTAWVTICLVQCIILDYETNETKIDFAVRGGDLIKFRRVLQDASASQAAVVERVFLTSYDSLLNVLEKIEAGIPRSPSKLISI